MVGDLVTTPLLPGSCGFVWVSSVLNHIPKKLLPFVLANFAQGLAPGGIFYANYRPPKEGVPDEGYLTSSEYIRSDNGSNVIRRFISHFSREEMIDLIRQAGLTVIEGRAYDEVYGTYNREKAEYLPKKEIIFARKN